MATCYHPTPEDMGIRAGHNIKQRTQRLNRWERGREGRHYASGSSLASSIVLVRIAS